MTPSSRGVKKDSIKVSEIAGYIDQIETGGGNSREVDCSDIDDDFSYPKLSIIIWPTHNFDYTQMDFEVLKGKPEPIASTTLEGGDSHIYVGVFKNTSEKVEIKRNTYFESWKEGFSGQIDISTSKVFVVKTSNIRSGEEPKQ